MARRSACAAAPAEEPAPLPLGSRAAARFRGLGLKEGDIRKFRGEAARPAAFEA
jgi:hypothetical protein